jgi:TolA-binding protein
MAKMATLTTNNRRQTERITDLEKQLDRCTREIETLQAQLGDNQSDWMLERAKSVLAEKVKISY